MPDHSPPRPDSKRMFGILVGLKMAPGSAYTLIQEVENMASANLIARFESKLDAQGERFAAGLADLRYQIRRERAMLWAVIALLGVAVMRYLIAG
ncbi:MAG: hypothetical protein OXN89_07515 [Bryobacterales bacterium]|nr:hypothetical protein [Bryobacterales bacterium]